MFHSGKETNIEGNLQKASQDGFLDVPLIKIDKITHDSFIYTYQLPDGSLPLGLRAGQHIAIHAKIPTRDYPGGEKIKRKYTPTSSIDMKGVFELLVKVYRRGVHPSYPEGGVLTQYLESLKIGDKIRIAGPTGKLAYFGDGNIVIRKKEDVRNLNVKRIGMICGGTGIAPMYQVIRAILDNPEDKTEVSLLFGNKTEEDVLLRKELGELATDPRFKLHYTLDAGSPGWKGFTGFVTPEMINKTMPAPGEGTLICVCGPRPMNKMLMSQLDNLGYTREQVHKF